MTIDEKACRSHRHWRRRLLIDMPVHALLVGCVLGLGAAVGVVHILAGLWNSGGIGINAGANSLTLLFLYAPAVTLGAGPASALVFGIVAKPTSRRSRTIGYGAAVVVTQASASAVPRCWDR